MSRISAMLASLCLASCALFARVDGGDTDLAQAADQVALFGQDIADLAPLAKPQTAVLIEELLIYVGRAEAALRAAGMGGRIADADAALDAALAFADVVLDQVDPDSDLRVAVAAARIVLRHARELTQ